MTTKEVEIKRVEKTICYVATDGTEFSNCDECKKYEESALGVMRAKIQDLITGTTVGSPVSSWDLHGGEDEHDVIAIKMNTMDDLDIVMQWFLLEHPYYNNPNDPERKNYYFNIFKQAFADEDCLLFGINYDKEYYFINTVNTLTARLVDFAVGLYPVKEENKETKTKNS